MPSPDLLVESIVHVGRLFPLRAPQLGQVVADLRYPFLKECFTLVIEGMLDDKTLARILEARIGYRFAFQIKQAKRLRAMARIPAALGLAGAVWFSVQGNAIDATAFIFHSLLLSYFLLIPAADWLVEKIEEERRIWLMIAQGAKLVVSRTNPVSISEELNSHLDPKQRVNWGYHALPAGKRAA